jgi:hypothetical protein
MGRLYVYGITIAGCATLGIYLHLMLKSRRLEREKERLEAAAKRLADAKAAANQRSIIATTIIGSSIVIGALVIRSRVKAYFAKH